MSNPTENKPEKRFDEKSSDSNHSTNQRNLHWWGFFYDLLDTSEEKEKQQEQKQENKPPRSGL